MFACFQIKLNTKRGKIVTFYIYEFLEHIILTKRKKTWNMIILRNPGCLKISYHVAMMFEDNEMGWHISVRWEVRNRTIYNILIGNSEVVSKIRKRADLSSFFETFSLHDALRKHTALFLSLDKCSDTQWNCNKLHHDYSLILFRNTSCCNSIWTWWTGSLLRIEVLYL